MNENQTIITEQSILENPYEKEVQEDIWRHERKKTMYTLLFIAAVFLIRNLIGFAVSNLLMAQFIFDIVLYPIVFAGLGLFARLQPMIAAICGALAFVAIAVLEYMYIGPQSLIIGWLYKGISIYFIVKSINHAKEAEAARKSLQSLS